MRQLPERKRQRVPPKIEVGLEMQTDYAELNLHEAEKAHECDRFRGPPLVRSDTCPQLIQYLTEKGSRVDATIRWGNQGDHTPNHKRSYDEQNDSGVRKLRRLATFSHSSYSLKDQNKSTSKNEEANPLKTHFSNPFDAP